MNPSNKDKYIHVLEGLLLSDGYTVHDLFTARRYIQDDQQLSKSDNFFFDQLTEKERLVFDIIDKNINAFEEMYFSHKDDFLKTRCEIKVNTLRLLKMELKDMFCEFQNDVYNQNIGNQFKIVESILKGEIMLNDKIDESKFKEYIKKPITIEAYQTDEEIQIETLEGTMTVNKGDYIIKGIKGEIYPCKPDIFKETYDIKIDGDIDLTGEVRQYNKKGEKK